MQKGNVKSPPDDVAPPPFVLSHKWKEVGGKLNCRTGFSARYDSEVDKPELGDTVGCDDVKRLVEEDARIHVIAELLKMLTKVRDGELTAAVSLLYTPENAGVIAGLSHVCKTIKPFTLF